MSNISNRFFVTALDDGATLHGNLVADKSLTQAWNGTSAIPDWTVAANQPTITLTLLSGAEATTPSSGDWYYNGQKLNFVSNLSTNVINGTTGHFQSGTNAGGQPTLKIVKNLAASGNTDEDVIAFAGAVSLSGASVEFNTSTTIRISTVTANGYLGVINFKDGVANITEDGGHVVMYGILFGGENGTEIAYNTGNGYTCKWFVNETEITATSGTAYKSDITIGGKTYPCLYLYEDAVVDYATVRCEFVVDGSTIFKDYVGVDDMFDEEYMYVQTEANGGNAASLRSGEHVKFFIWVGKETDPTVDQTWNTFKLKLLNSEGNPITEGNLADSIPNCDTGSEWRTLPVDGTSHKAYVQVAYDTAHSYGNNITGIVMAIKNA